MKVLLAVGEKNLAKLLRGHMADAGFDVAKEDVLHRSYLEEIVEMEQPGLLILHDTLLMSDQPDQESNEQELLQLLEKWRRRYDTQMRVCVMCERERRDPFLSKLVARNVLDIFNERQIKTSEFVEQLKEPAKYVNVARYGVTESAIDSLMDEAEVNNQEVEVDAVPAEAEKTKSFPKKSLPKIPKAPQIRAPRFQIHVHKQLIEEQQRALQERQVILVISPFERTGSSFIALQLAYQISRENIKVHYFENPLKRPYAYDRLAGHLAARNYFSPYSDIPDDDERVFVREWTKDGIGLQALNPLYEKQLREEQFPISRFLRQLLSVHDAAYLIVDVGADTSKTVYDELIEIASQVLVVVDSDLPRLEMFSQYQMLDEFSWIHNVLLDKKTLLVANRYAKEIKDSLPVDDFIGIPSFPDAAVIKAQVEGSFELQDANEQKKMDACFAKLTDRVLQGQNVRKRKSNIRKIKHWMPKILITKETHQEG